MPKSWFSLNPILFITFVAIIAVLAGYNINGQSDLNSSLNTLEAVQGNDFGLKDVAFQKGHSRVVVRTEPHSDVVTFFVPSFLTERRLLKGRNDEQIRKIGMVTAIDQVPGLQVTDVYTGEIVADVDSRYQKSMLIRRGIDAILGNLEK